MLFPTPAPLGNGMLDESPFIPPKPQQPPEVEHPLRSGRMELMMMMVVVVVMMMMMAI